MKQPSANENRDKQTVCSCNGEKVRNCFHVYVGLSPTDTATIHT